MFFFNNLINDLQKQKSFCNGLILTLFQPSDYFVSEINNLDNTEIEKLVSIFTGKIKTEAFTIESAVDFMYFYIYVLYNDLVDMFITKTNDEIQNNVYQIHSKIKHKFILLGKNINYAQFIILLMENASLLNKTKDELLFYQNVMYFDIDEILTHKKIYNKTLLKNCLYLLNKIENYNDSNKLNFKFFYGNLDNKNKLLDHLYCCDVYNYLIKNHNIKELTH